MIDLTIEELRVKYENIEDKIPSVIKHSYINSLTTGLSACLSILVSFKSMMYSFSNK